jgi:hypothetical protein
MTNMYSNDIEKYTNCGPRAIVCWSRIAVPSGPVLR